MKNGKIVSKHINGGNEDKIVRLVTDRVLFININLKRLVESFSQTYLLDYFVDVFF